MTAVKGMMAWEESGGLLQGEVGAGRGCVWMLCVQWVGWTVGEGAAGQTRVKVGGVGRCCCCCCRMGMTRAGCTVVLAGEAGDAVVRYWWVAGAC